MMLRGTRSKLATERSKQGFLAIVTFDLHGAEPLVYKRVKEELGHLRLRKYLRDRYGENKRLPANIFAAKYRDADDISARDLRNTLTDEVFDLMGKLRVKATIFVAVAKNDWAAGRVKA